MIKPRHTKLQIPVELSKYVYRHRLIAPFSIYLYLKLFSDGKLQESSPVFAQMRTDLKMKDNRTFKKHIRKVQELGWLGYNEKSGYYFIRSLDHLRFIYIFKKRRASTLLLQDINKLQIYLVGVILSTEVIGQRYYWEYKRRRKLRTATKRTDVANQSEFFSAFPGYYGLSVHSISKLLGCKPTRASVLKNAAAQMGYVKVNKMFLPFAKLSQADYILRPNINDIFPKIRGHLRVIPKCVKGLKEYHIVLQCHDEIIPQMKFKTINKFNNLKVFKIAQCIKIKKPPHNF